jgi:hypothetical protein
MDTFNLLALLDTPSDEILKIQKKHFDYVKNSKTGALYVNIELEEQLFCNTDDKFRDIILDYAGKVRRVDGKNYTKRDLITIYQIDCFKQIITKCKLDDKTCVFKFGSTIDVVDRKKSSQSNSNRNYIFTIMSVATVLVSNLVILEHATARNFIAKCNVVNLNVPEKNELFTIRMSDLESIYPIITSKVLIPGMTPADEARITMDDMKGDVDIKISKDDHKYYFYLSCEHEFILEKYPIRLCDCDSATKIERNICKMNIGDKCDTAQIKKYLGLGSLYQGGIDGCWNYGGGIKISGGCYDNGELPNGEVIYCPQGNSIDIVMSRSVNSMLIRSYYEYRYNDTIFDFHVLRSHKASQFISKGVRYDGKYYVKDIIYDRRQVMIRFIISMTDDTRKIWLEKGKNIDERIYNSISAHI